MNASSTMPPAADGPLNGFFPESGSDSGQAAGLEPQARLRRLASWASVSVAFVLLVAKLACYLDTDSVSLLASLIDTVTDLLASLLTVLGVHHALRPADGRHRFGHGKAEALAALGQAAFVTGSAAFLVIEAAGRLIRPQPVEDSLLGVAVMVLAMALTTGLVLFQRRVVRLTGSLAIRADRLHYLGDLAMNAAVMVSLVASAATGWTRIDPLFALGIAALLSRAALAIAGSALDTLMDHELPETQRERVRTLVLAHPEVRGMHDLCSRSSGAGVFLQLHLELDRHLPLVQAHDITEEIERRLMAAFPNASVIIHQEPAGVQDDRLDDRIAAAEAAQAVSESRPDPP
jgi:ferrous-iron efflux pump FieF